ncbi:histidine--tRNA ligase [Spiroplasma platyhelix]|uniref:Histidine--tRNA ligase n=1 Tax=Spiroplasma platyhelix PALS-1 TaxID=1276218 RepID=A0A846TWJ0_9MOLU|nr:histidine--tRNA ligase [Spiroplasma platyhelix]MBE4704020.1 Histidine--tRNA ligase [Spiroplasma platyhelix PALS-1]NKE38391.1 histidine--tRNA ligase [Spiroplasma platyhelix PALS-1]UJB29278.1 histidyl-tRNA synthetase [Spiroplasma platyhelix PALS-1]
MKFQRPKGTEDLYNQQVVLYSNIINRLIAVAKKFNYQEIITPVIESAELFLRSIGSTTNIVEKEIYQFLDKGNRMLALRPEGTAGVIRAVVENKLYTNQKQTQKYFYYGTMYRYENPQKGRNREFHQFGVEVLATKSPLLDVEVILLANTMLEELTIKDADLHLNYFGSEVTKKKFNDALLTVLMKEKNKLCADCQKRIEKNPLRVLDCQTCQKLDLNLPLIEQFYSTEEKQYFQELSIALTKLEINFKVDPYLVRGLDYYNGVIFEFMSDSSVLGKSQNTLIGGGRYDNLSQDLGVPYQYPAIGFAFGIERLMLLLEKQPEFNLIQPLDLFVASIYQAGLAEILVLVSNLRKTKYFVDGIFDLFNDKQKSNLIKNLKNCNNLLILEKQGQASLYQLTKEQKVTVSYQSEAELLQKVVKLLG